MPDDSVAPQRLLLVHAHPDDETITTGATIAHYVAAGAQVSVVTCTLGEEGEILVPTLAGLEAAQADQLGGYRIAELAAAMTELGVRDHRYLGGAGRFRDSGMAGSSAHEHPRAFVHTGAHDAMWDEALRALVGVLLDVRPHVVVTYDPSGGYGHPDHIAAHRLTMAAVPLAAEQGWAAAKVYWVVDTLGEATTVIDASARVSAKAAALAAHATQVSVTGDSYALSNGIVKPISGIEYFRCVLGTPAIDSGGHESDLFAGVTDDAA